MRIRAGSTVDAGSLAPYISRETELRRAAGGLNIDTEEALRLAEELSRATGESIPDAVTTALRERLARVQRGDREGLVERLHAIAADSAPRWKEPWRSMEHGDLLYGENGLPK